MAWLATADQKVTADSGLARYLEEIRRVPMLEAQDRIIPALWARMSRRRPVFRSRPIGAAAPRRCAARDRSVPTVLRRALFCDCPFSRPPPAAPPERRHRRRAKLDTVLGPLHMDAATNGSPAHVIGELFKMIT